MLEEANVNKSHKLIEIIFTGVVIVSCGRITSTPSEAVITTPNPTLSLPLIVSTVEDTITPTITPLPTCTPVPAGNIYMIDESVYNDVDAGLVELGVKGAIEVLQQALEDHHPEWAQEDGLARYVRDHSHAQTIGINPRVFLVMAGVALDWRLPNDHDVRDDIIQIGITLTQHYRSFQFDENLQSNYPQVANAPSYALYTFFDFDLEKIDNWQQEYDRMFGELQPRIVADGCQITVLPAFTPDFCNITQSQGEIQLISGLRFTALEPGGPLDFDRILAEQDPTWADFQQDVHGELRSAGVVFHETAFGPELGTGVNPAVLLVTYGVERDWELPANGDLASEVDGIRARLHQYELEWILKTVDRSQYPVANAAAYALYRYFNGDLPKLESWCQTYVQVYNESPLK